MENHIYYGEYSLKHWIELLLSRDIVLPEYQRSFVWDEADIARLIKSFQEKQFVQPVTIVLFKPHGVAHPKNLLIDGQQRLTSVLLARIGYMPDRSKFKMLEDIAEDDDSINDETAVANEQSQNDKKGPIEWTFETMLGDTTQKSDLTTLQRDLASNNKYTAFNTETNDEFFENTFLGFSYIVPDSDNEQEIQHSFAQLFRNINYFGRRLSPLESRRSLYYMNNNLKNYFEGKTVTNEDVLCGIKIRENLQAVNLDFVRYLATLSQYKVKGVNEVLKWYSAYKSRESYYADYVSYLLGLEQESYPHKFDGITMSGLFPNNEWKQRFSTLRESVEKLKDSFQLDDKTAFSSWIDADYWLYGLIYQIVFEGKTLNVNHDLLSTQIRTKINEKRNDDYYSKNPNRLGNLRDRIEDSIRTYSHHVH